MDKITQSGNTVGGDLAAGDIHKHVHLPPSPTHVSRLNARLRAERASNVELGKLIDRLQHFTASIDEAGPIGLAAKLTAASKSAWIEGATRDKEVFAKRLLRTDLSETAQLLLLVVLTRVVQWHATYVKPRLQEQCDDERLRRCVQEEIVDRLAAHLETNDLDLMPDELEGAVWYLTGNCFLNWQ